MKYHLFVIKFLLCLSFLLSSNTSIKKELDGLKYYPKIDPCDHVDVYHGTKVKDPYRELENSSSLTSQQWVQDQIKLTESYFSQIPQREAILSRLIQLQDYERYSLPLQRGNRFFFSKNDGLQNQSIIYTTQKLDQQPQVVLNPNILSKDGSDLVSHTAITDDGSLIAYSVSKGGSDWQTIKVKDVRTGCDLEDKIEWVKFSKISWDKKGNGFYYSRFPQPRDGNELHEVNHFHKLYYHKLGTEQSEDRLVYEAGDHKDWIIVGHVTEDGKYLLLHVYDGCQKANAVFYKDLSQPNNPVIALLTDFDAAYSFVGNEGTKLWFHTTYKAINARLISIDITEPQKDKWQEIIPESKDNLKSISFVGHRFFANYMHDVHTQIKVFDRGGHFIRDVELPGIGMVFGFQGKKNDSETFFAYTSFAAPRIIYRYDIKSGQSQELYQPQLKFDPNEFVTKQVFYTSKDGTRVPMFISYKKDTKLDGTSPALLCGYGGFGLSIEPSFSILAINWMEQGGIYCIANIRGGGEYGERWHKEGIKLNKQNGFNDFISAAEYLIQNNYTHSSRLAIKGESNGGLLVGAVINQRPKLFGAAIAHVAVMDMIRFNQFTIGKAWESEYGSPHNPEEFEVLYSYSPYHNINQNQVYPPILVTTSDRDDRVVPLHSFKYIAALQNTEKKAITTNPYLIRIAKNIGHGSKKSTKQHLSEAADDIAFLLHVLKREHCCGSLKSE